MTLKPAYGRDYKSRREVLEDFNADRDFVIADITSRWDGKVVNKSQLLDTKIYRVNIRYKKLTQIMVVEVVP